MQKNKIVWLFLGILIILAYFCSLNVRPLYRPDEMRYTEIAMEMIANQDYVAPTLNGLPYYEKPVMGHWLNAFAFNLFGDTLFSARISCALLTVLGALLLFWVVRKVADRRTAAWSAMIYLTTPLVFGIGTFMVLDAPFAFFLLVMWLAFYMAYHEKEHFWKREGFLAVCGIACGCAFMTKGFLVLLLPGITIVPFLLIRKEYKALFIMWITPLIFTVLAALPWSLAVYRQDPDFWNYFFYHEHIQRFLTGSNGGDNRSQGFWYFIPVLLLGFLPWTLLFLTAVIGFRSAGGVWKSLKEKPLLMYSACCAVFMFIFFSLSSGKLATYILPVFPWIAIISASGFLAAFEHGSTKYFNFVCKYFGLVLMIGAILFGAWELLGQFSVLPDTITLYNNSELWMLGIIAVIIFGLQLIRASGEKTPDLKLSFIFIGILIPMFAAYYVIPAKINAPAAPRAFLKAYADKVTPDTMLIADAEMISSTNLAFGRRDVYLVGKTDEFKYGMERDGNRRLLTREEFFDIVRKRDRDIILVTEKKRRYEEVYGYVTLDVENGENWILGFSKRQE